MPLTLRSPAFADGERIPDRFARTGDNLSPPLDWQDAPEGTRSFLLIVEDPDAPGGTFRHWAVFDLPADRTGLEEGAGRPGSGVRHGTNDFGSAAYDGPEPPEGHGPHHYHFRLAALDIDHLEVDPGRRVGEIWAAARPHMLAEAGLVGLYERGRG